MTRNPGRVYLRDVLFLDQTRNRGIHKILDGDLAHPWTRTGERWWALTLVLLTCPRNSAVSS